MRAGRIGRYCMPGVLLAVLSGPVTAAGVGDIAPDWSLRTPSGESIRFHDDSSGGVAVVLFWATWCPYCRELMPHVQAVADDHADRPVKFYALNVWEEGDPVAYLARQGFTFTLLLSGESAADAWGVRGTPGLFVVDGKHRILYRRGAGEDDLDVELALRESISAALARQAGAEPATPLPP